MEVDNELLLQKLKKSLGSNYLDLSPLFIPSIKKAPHIYSAVVNKPYYNSYVVKVIYKDHQIIGEENSSDVIFDYFISDFYKRNKIYTQARELLSFFELDSQHEVVVSSYIRGSPLDSVRGHEILSKRYTEVLKHLKFNFTKTDLTNHISINRNLWGSYESLINKKLQNIDSISFLKHFRNDINRTNLPDSVKRDLSDLINSSYMFENCVEKSLIHADLKHNNIILTTDNKLIPIDWSASHIGCPAIDIADILVSSKNYTSNESTLELLKKFTQEPLTKKYFHKESLKLVKLYLFFKVFSISRVWIPRYLKTTANEIISMQDKSLEEVITGFRWLVRRKY